MIKTMSETITYGSVIREKSGYLNPVILKASIIDGVIKIEPLAFHQLENITSHELERIADFFYDLHNEIK